MRTHLPAMSENFSHMSPGEIGDVLSIYKDDCIAVRSATVTADQILCSIEMKHYAFTKEEYIDYVTASMMMLYLSQVGYLYLYSKIKNNSEEVREWTLEDFRRSRNSGNVFITSIDKVRHSGRIYISEGLMTISMAAVRTLHHKNRVHSSVRFSAGNGRCCGAIKVGIERTLP